VITSEVAYLLVAVRIQLLHRIVITSCSIKEVHDRQKWYALVNLTVLAAPPAAIVGTGTCPTMGTTGVAGGTTGTTGGVTGVTGGVTGGTTGSTIMPPAGLASAVTVHTPVGAIHILAKWIHMPAWKHSVYS
jgi:hypothetical protein